MICYNEASRTGACNTRPALSTTAFDEKGRVMAEANPTHERRDIPEFPGYSIAADGRVFGPRSELRPKLHNGYPRICLWRDGKQCWRMVHVLVLIAFTGPRPDGMEACHADGDRSNCNLFNLRWDTKSGNWNDRVSHGRGNTTGHKYTVEQVLEMRERHRSGESSQSIIDRFGVSRSQLGKIIRRTHWGHV